MTDQVAGQPSEGASPEGTAYTKADIDKIVADVTAKFEERIKGFQRLLGERDTKEKALQAELDEVRSSSLSPEERAQLREKQLQQKVRELQAQIELEKLSSEFPDEMPIYRELLSAQSAQEQLARLRALRAPAASSPTTPAAPEEIEEEVPEVDMNNPMRKPLEGVKLPDGRVMTDELADRILGAVSKQADVTQRGG